MVLLRTVIKSKFENYTDNQMCVTKMQVEQVNSEDYNTDDDPLSIQMMQKKRTLLRKHVRAIYSNISRL